MFGRISEDVPCGILRVITEFPFENILNEILKGIAKRALEEIFREVA